VTYIVLYDYLVNYHCTTHL